VSLIIVFYCLIFFTLNLVFDLIPRGSVGRKIYYFGYTFLEYISFASIFWIIIENKIFKKFIFVTSIFFIVFQIIYYLTAQNIRLDTLPIGVETILVFIYIFYFFFEQFKSTKNQLLYSNYVFWIVIGIMIYLGGTFFFNILANHLNNEQIVDYWYFSFLADILKNIFFSVGLFVFSQQPKSKKMANTSLPYLDMI